MLHGCPPSPDAWGRLNVVTPFHHLSGDSHINSSLREGPLRHLASQRPHPSSRNSGENRGGQKPSRSVASENGYPSNNADADSAGRCLNQRVFQRDRQYSTSLCQSTSKATK